MNTIRSIQLPTDIYTIQESLDSFLGCEHIPQTPNSEFKFNHSDDENVFTGGGWNKGMTGTKDPKCNFLGGKHTEEHKQKMTGAGNPNFGIRHTEEAKQRISKNKTGVKLGPQSKEQIAKRKASMRATMVASGRWKN